MNKRLPFVISVITRGASGLCHCNVRGAYTIEFWYDMEYHNRLKEYGINNEYAARMTADYSIKRQRLEGSKPCLTSAVCLDHAVESIDKYMGSKVGAVELGMLELLPGSALFVIDRNETREHTYPSLALFSERDVAQFLRMYEKGGYPVFSLK